MTSPTPLPTDDALETPPPREGASPLPNAVTAVSSESSTVAAADPTVSEQPAMESQPATVPAPSRTKDWLNDPVTQHMGTAAPLLWVDQTVTEALETVRACPTVGRIVYFYVVDADQRLEGVVATRKLLLSQPTMTIRELMSTTTIAIPSTATVLEACQFFADHKLLAFPVIDSERKVIGAVDIDLYTEEVKEIDRRQDADDLFQLVGIHLSEAAKVRAGPAFLGRFPWLLCNVGGGMLSALIADAYQDVSTLAAVAPFIALVTALSESVSIQSVGLALQVLHAQPPKWDVFARKLQLELLVGLLLGGACGLVVGIVALLWKGSFVVAASLFLGITGGVVMSAGVGLALPFLMRLCHRDPQLASGPMALALADVVTLLCYFNLGRWLLS